jgi:hypothetical protein
MNPFTTTWSISAHGNAFHSALPPIDWITAEQFFTVKHDWSHLVVECCTETALSDDNVSDVTACYLAKQQLLSIYEGNSISKLQIQVANYVFELSAGNCHR